MLWLPAELTEREKEVLSNVVKVIVEVINPCKILLFGSRSKGKFSIHSDFDLAVDVSRPEIEREVLLNEKIEEVCGLYSIDIVYIPNVDHEFMEIILNNGKLIYERK